MTITHPKRLGALALLATIALGACSGGGATTAPSAEASSEAPSEAPASEPAANLSGSVTIDGSSTVYPDHRGRRRGVPGRQRRASRSSAAFSGTGGGFKKFCAGETDINDASRPIKKDDDGEGKACTTNGVNYVELQVAHRRPDGRRQPGEHLRHLPDQGRAGQDLRPGLARRTSAGTTSNPSVPGPAGRPVHAGRRLGHVRLLHRDVNGKVDAATQFATQSEDDNVLVTGVAGDVERHRVLRLRVLRREQRQAQGRRDRRRQRLRRPDRRDDQRQPVRAAQPPAVHLPEHRTRPKDAARAQGLRGLLPRQRRRRSRPRSATSRSPTTCSSKSKDAWAAAVGG